MSLIWREMRERHVADNTWLTRWELRETRYKLVCLCSALCALCAGLCGWALLQCGPRGLVLMCHVLLNLVTNSVYKVALQYWLCSCSFLMLLHCTVFSIFFVSLKRWQLHYFTCPCRLLLPPLCPSTKIPLKDTHLAHPSRFKPSNYNSEYGTYIAIGPCIFHLHGIGKPSAHNNLEVIRLHIMKIKDQHDGRQ